MLNSIRLQPKEPWSQEDKDAFNASLMANVTGLQYVNWEEPPPGLDEIA